jgi:PcfJ-like protein
MTKDTPFDDPVVGRDEPKQLAFTFLTEILGPKPVELLRDGRGVYGIGIPHFYRQERSDDHELRRSHTLILRPDRFDDSPPVGAVLQKIVGGFRHGMFSHTPEEYLRQFIHHEALRRAGLRWPAHLRPDDPEWWSANKKQQARNRAIYHGLRLLSLRVINKLIGTMLEQAADPDAVKAARRFAFRYREYIYRACAQSRRALQLVDTFPLLALAIYSPSCPSNVRGGYLLPWDERDADRRRIAADRVERGARLRDVAAAMNIPMVLRAIKPGAAHLTTEVFCQYPELVRFLPANLSRARDWIKLVCWAEGREAGREFTLWAARMIPQIPGGIEQVGSFLCDMSDWVKADHKLIARSFVSSMSLKTVTKLCADWHEAVASQMDGPDFIFSSPWYPKATIGAFEIIPIENAAELRREGAAMHHCAGAYGKHVKDGTLYVYSIRRDGKRMATLALGRARGATWIDQLRGPCNAQPSKNITAAVLRWHRAQTGPPDTALDWLAEDCKP